MAKSKAPDKKDNEINPIVIKEPKKKLDEKANQLKTLPGLGLKNLNTNVDISLFLSSSNDYKNQLISQWEKNDAINLTKDQKQSLINTLGLLRVTGSDTKMISELSKAGINSTKDLVKQNVDSISKIIKDGKVIVPPSKDTNTYAFELLAQVEAEYPSAFFLYRLVEKPEYINIDKKLIPQPSSEFRVFYDKNKEFDLKNEPILSIETGKLNAKILGVGKGDAKLVKELFQTQQALKLSNDSNLTALLLKKNVDIKKAVSSTHESLMRDLGVDMNTATSIKKKAQDLHEVAINGYFAYRDIVSNPFLKNTLENLTNVNDQILNGIGGKENWEDFKAVNGLKDIDSISDLFGSQNYCECDSCKSVLSPAAYFVDLMKFTEQRVLMQKMDNLETIILDKTHPIHLKVRRPDLWKLELSCDNTNKRIPYIEIVNEVLSSFIQNQLNDGKTISKRILEEKPNFEFTLPYNQPLDEVRIWLSFFNHSRYEVLEFLYPSPTDDDKLKLAIEKLNLSIEQYNIIINQTLEAKVDADVLAFRKKSNLTPDETEQITKLSFWKGGLSIIQKKDPTDIQKFTLDFNSNIANWQGKLHRLFRLWKQSEFSLSDLELIFNSFGIDHTTLNKPSIINIATFKSIQQVTQLRTEIIAGMISGIKETNIDSQALSWNNILPKGWVSNQTISLDELLGNITDISLNLILQLQGIFGLNTTDMLYTLKLLKQKIGNDSGSGFKITFNIQTLNTIYLYAQMYKLSEVSSMEVFEQLLFIYGKGEIKYFDNPSNDILSFKMFLSSYEKINISSDDLVYIFGNELNSDLLNPEDKIALTASEMQVFCKSKFFANGDKFILFFNRWLGIDLIALSYFKTILSSTEQNTFNNAINDLILKNSSTIDGSIKILSSIKRKILRLEFLMKKYNIDDESIKALNEATIECKYPKLGFTDWMDGNWVNEIAFLGEWINETKSIRNLNLWTTLKSIEKDAVLPETTKISVVKWKNMDIFQANIITPKTTSITALHLAFEKIKWSQKLNISATLLESLKSNNEVPQLMIQSQLLQNAIKSKYDKLDEWELKIQDYKNKLSSNLRDALCNFIIFNSNIRSKGHIFDDREDLYRYFLLDVRMGDCFTLPRIVMATNSLQVYIDRCIMGLEISRDETVRVLLDLDEKEEWQWRKNYRVWEANRKIFLFPENYIEPEIRDNKSPEFKELEDELLQQKLNSEVVENAYKKYIQQIMTLAELRIAGAYRDVESNKIYLFGKTNKQPVEYYYRNVEFLESGGVIWSNWEKMNIAIPVDDISAINYNGKLHIFWTTFQRKDISDVFEGTQSIIMHVYDVFVNYSFLQIDKKWSAPQRIEMGYRSNSPFDPFLRQDIYKDLVESGPPKIKEEGIKIRENVLREFEKVVFRKPYPIIAKDQNLLRLDYIWTDKKNALTPLYKYTKASINSYSIRVKVKVRILLLNTIFEIEAEPEFSFNRYDEVVNIGNSSDSTRPPTTISINNKTYSFYYGPERLDFVLSFIDNNKYSLTTGNSSGNSVVFFKESNTEVKSGNYDLHHEIVYIPIAELNNEIKHIKVSNQKMVSVPETQFEEGDSFWLEYKSYFDGFNDFFVSDGSFTYADGISDFKIQQRDKVAILTTPAKAEINDGYTLNPEQIQMLWDKVSLNIESLLDYNTQRQISEQIDYGKSFGNYFYELFFHIPMRIADHLNAAGKYREADNWYGFIYNPTAIKDKFEQLAFAHDVNWRFASFRNIGIKKLQEIYSDPNSIEIYQRNPGNPHAIARLRIGAYQKNVVMKYLDNLMDWADNLFEQFTPESTSEARHLYNIVKTILGDKPESVGKCKETRVMSYSDIIGNANSEFIYNVFTISPVYYNSNNFLNVNTTNNSMISSETTTNKTFTNKNPSKINLTEEKSKSKSLNLGEITKYSIKDTLMPDKALGRPMRPLLYFNLEVDLLFCFPHNQDFINYWDRVNDRIFKLNHCMDLYGVKKIMPAFAPPIDPALLARMVASGLSFEEIIAAINGSLPRYRFNYLIEKAKQYCGTVQNFGGALFGAIEKKDSEELTLLRARHEQNILSLTTSSKKRQIEQAKANLANLLENKIGIEKRKSHYESLIEEGLLAWETAEQIAKWTSGGVRTAEGILQILSGTFGLLPQIGSPFAMKYGGFELSSSAEKFANALEATAKIADNVAILAGMEASHQRREQDWKFQVITTSQELKSLNEQIKASEINLAMAEYDLELHNANIEQYKELYDFYTTKFSNYQHYTLQVQQMQKLYRMAFNLANDMAMQAQKAFEFERYGVDSINTGFIQPDNWNNEKIGMLAGEKLLLQLQQMEKEFIDTDKRKIEITQHFSMMQIAPDKLLELKMEGKCNDFSIPEAAFDLIYPGYFRRIIKSVRITIPCIVGPYTNIGATLSLGNNKIRSKTDGALIDFNFSGTGTIATSSAQNDGGQFELNFRDERYLPFEGAGAVSSWTLSLPNTVRAFDYNTISDVIFHISYTADYDGTFKGKVEETLIDDLNKISGDSLFRGFSMKHDFPNEWHQLNQASNNANIKFELRKEHFPYFANVDSIEGIADFAYVLDTKNELSKIAKPTEQNSSWISFVGMMVTIPISLIKPDRKDLIFIVEYKIG